MLSRVMLLAFIFVGCQLELFADKWELSVERENGCYYIYAEARTPAGTESVVWDVLTDFENLDEFVPKIESSEILQQIGKQEFLLYQTVKQRILFFKKTINLTLSVKTAPSENSVHFSCRGGDFIKHQGLWKMERSGDYCRIIFQAESQPKDSIPLFGKSIIRYSSRKNLESILDEIYRRIEGHQIEH